MKLIGMIADHPTPKFSGGGTAFTLSERDYKGVMCIVISESDRLSDGEQPSRVVLRTGCVQRYVRNGEKT